MKILNTLLLLLTCPTLAISAANTYTLSAGTSVVRIGNDDPNPKTEMISLGVRYYITPTLFSSINLTHWNSGETNVVSESAEILTLNIGYRTYFSRWFTDVSLGIGYLNNPDGVKYTVDGNVTEAGYLTGSSQFEINLGGGYRITEYHMNIIAGWTHFSNCETICNLDPSYAPNIGRDFLRIGIEKRF